VSANGGEPPFLISSSKEFDVSDGIVLEKLVSAGPDMYLSAVSVG
jgi:hypothetical protein